MATAAAWAALAWGTLALLLGLVARARCARLPTWPPTAAAGLRCRLVRPCAGDEPSLERCLGSTARARAVGDLVEQVIFAVSEQDDPATRAIDVAMAALDAAGVPARRLVAPPDGPNRKAALLHAAATGAPPGLDVLVNVDSNVDLDGVDLAALLAPFTDPGVGAVWAPPVEAQGAPSAGGRATEATLGGSLHAFPLLCGLDPGGLVGKTFAVRLSALDQTGGFGALTHHLGEDMELSRRLQARGWRVHPLRSTVPAVAGAVRVRDVVARMARWMRVIRAQRPWLLVTYPLFFFPTPFVLVLAGLGASAAPKVAAAAVVVGVAGRLAVAALASAACGRRPGPVRALVDSVIADAVLLAAFGAALASRRFTWRGQPLRIEPGGRLGS